MGFFRQDTGVSCHAPPPPGDLPKLGIKPGFSWQLLHCKRILYSRATGKPFINRSAFIYSLNQQTIIGYLLLSWIFGGCRYPNNYLDICYWAGYLGGCNVRYYSCHEELTVKFRGSRWRLINVYVFWTEVEKFNFNYNAMSVFSPNEIQVLRIYLCENKSVNHYSLY